MKRFVSIICAFVLLLMLAAPALASNFYIIPDSDKRRLTREELWTWQLAVMMYIVNEIFARHGFHFEPGGKYDNYFRSQLWYRENEMYTDNQDIYKHLVSDIEWYNENLAKQVRDEMRALGTTNPNGKPLPKVAYEPPLYGAFSSFFPQYFAPNQKLAVYSGPGAQYHRSADGKAMASTNGEIYVGGWENGWLMVMYWTNNGNIRVGYAQSKDFKDKVGAPQLMFDYIPATIMRRCVLTDDPVATYQTMAVLDHGAQVTYLSEYINEYRWAYVETMANGVLMRGFVEADAVQILSMLENEPSYAPASALSGMKVLLPVSTGDFTEHLFWGISPENWGVIYTVLDEKNIQYEVTAGSRTSRIDSKEGQTIMMFGIPVDLAFRFDAGTPNELLNISICTSGDWDLHSVDVEGDPDMTPMKDAYITMLKAVEDQYGSITGGYLATRDNNMKYDTWNYPQSNRQPDFDVVFEAFKQNRTVDLITYIDNISVVFSIGHSDETINTNMKLTFYYNLDVRADDYVAPVVSDFYTFERPSGAYTSEPQKITIGF